MSDLQAMKTEITSHRIVKNKAENLKVSGLRKINILFGKNGSGKSSFLRNIYNTNSNDFHLVVPERSGGSFVYSSNIYDQESQDDQRKQVRSSNFDNQYRNRSISRTVAISQSIGFKKMNGEGGGLDNLNKETIENLFNIFLPEFRARFSHSIPHQIEFYRIIDQTETKVTNTNELSSGQAEALSLAADIVTQAVLWKKQNKCILIDEPDAHLHLDLQNRFAIFIKEISSEFDVQFIIASHSQGLIAALMNQCEDIGVLCLDTNFEEIHTIPKNKNFVFSNLLSSDLAIALILGKKIVIVEGNDDYLVWNQAGRNQGFTDISLIEAGGGDILEYKKYIEKILKSICDDITSPVGITITDRDKKNDANHDKGTMLPIQRFSCYSIENLLITKEILETFAQGIDLNSELEIIKENCNQDERIIIDCLKTDSKNTQIPKELIRKIHSHLDKHSDSIDWRIRIGKLLGKQRPTGELLDFIGNDIVEYIYGPAPLS